MTGTCGWHPVDKIGLTVTFLERQAGLCLRGEADMLGVGALREEIAARLAAAPCLPSPAHEQLREDHNR